MCPGDKTAHSHRKHPCSDCRYCQWCGDDRCRLCRDCRPGAGRKLSLQEQIELYEALNKVEPEDVKEDAKG